MLRHVSALTVGRLQEAGKSFSVYSLWFNLYGRTSTYRSFATTVSQPKISDFLGENFKGFEVLYFSLSATTTQLLSSG
jgi:hypothetical protein